MHVHKCIVGNWKVTAIAASMLIAASALAEERKSIDGYLVDSQGNIVHSGAGDCVHTGNWTPEKATVVGCDGVTLDAHIEIVKGQPTGIVKKFVFPTASLFAFDSAEVSSEGKQSLDSRRTQLMPLITSSAAAVIIGHTDSTGNAQYNEDLSLRRAMSVRDYLVSTGTPTDKLSVIGRGAKDPIAAEDTAEGRAQNRRVEVVVVGELRGLDALRFPSATLFPRRSADLTAEGKVILGKNLANVKDSLQNATYIEVVGHTDDVGDDAYNQDLSEQRATVVRNFLVSQGIDGSKVVAKGAGERKPIASNNTDEGRAENRRVEILVLGRLKD